MGQQLETRILRVLEGKIVGWDDLIVMLSKFDDEDVLRVLTRLITSGLVSVSRGVKRQA